MERGIRERKDSAKKCGKKLRFMKRQRSEAAVDRLALADQSAGHVSALAAS